MKLYSPRGNHTRPTKDQVREAMFNILQSAVRGQLVLDAFAGSGALGLEALSRGAKMVYFLETNRDARTVIARNLQKTGYEGSAVLSGANALAWLTSYKGDKFGLIFLDPPYHQGWEEKMLDILEKGNLLRNDGIVVVETGSSEPVRESRRPGKLALKKRAVYGNTALCFYTWSNGED